MTNTILASHSMAHSLARAFARACGAFMYVCAPRYDASVAEDPVVESPDEHLEQLHRLVTRAQRGDRHAFDRMVELLTPRIYNLAFRWFGNPDDAWEVAQDAFVRMYRSLPSFRGDARITTWAHSVAVFACKDRQRSMRRRPTPESLDAPTATGHTLADVIEDPQRTEDLVLRQESQREIQRAIAQLPNPFRETLLLFHVSGLSHQEVADTLGTNIGTVKSRLNRARQQLRQILWKIAGNPAPVAGD